jgi:Leucine-rich repeat (LRR) protein
MYYCCVNCCMNKQNSCEYCKELQTNSNIFFFKWHLVTISKNCSDSVTIIFDYTPSEPYEFVGFPQHITEFSIIYKYYSHGWDIPEYGSLEKITNLPEGLKILNCQHNSITQLDNLPWGLKILNCQYNKITQLDNLPNCLEKLICAHNQLVNLSCLPESLEYLDCSHNKIENLDNLPNSIKYLYTSGNPIRNYFSLPDKLIQLNDAKYSNYSSEENKSSIIKCLNSYKNYVQSKKQFV